MQQQAAALEGWLPRLDQSDWTRPSPLPDWLVAHLVLHLAQTLRVIAESVANPGDETPLTVGEYLSRLPAAAAEIRDREVAGVAGRTPGEIIAEFAEQHQKAGTALAGMRGTEVVGAPRGPLRVADFLATRALELVVHADDLGRALPGNPPPTRREATAVSVRLLADLLATNAPGRSVEVRIPPYAAVQCVPGPRHTRGTPPTVIETDAVTWLRLATGRTSWAEALEAGRVNASGERSDLSPYLPLIS